MIEYIKILANVFNTCYKIIGGSKYMSKKIYFNFRLPIKLIKRKKWFLASCPVLDVHSQGETEKQARKNLIEALSVFFISCLERDTLDTVLKNCGFKPIMPFHSDRKKSIVPPKDYIDVPIPFLVKQNKRVGCHA